MLVSCCEDYCRENKMEFLTVKTLDESREDEGYGKTYTIRDFMISPLEISFAIDNARPLTEMMEDPSSLFRISEHVRIELVYEDGAVREYNMTLTGWSVSVDWADNYEREPSEARVYFGGSVVDVETLAAIRVNGVDIKFE
jgi:hypothetical protein